MKIIKALYLAQTDINDHQFVIDTYHKVYILPLSKLYSQLKNVAYAEIIKRYNNGESICFKNVEAKPIEYYEVSDFINLLEAHKFTMDIKGRYTLVENFNDNILVEKTIKEREANKTLIKKYKDDAGFDIYLNEDIYIEPNSSLIIKTNIKNPIQAAKDKGHFIPSTVYGRIVGRSSTFIDLNLIVIEGIIDHGYTDNISITVYNASNAYITVSKERPIAQFITAKNSDYDHYLGLVNDKERNEKAHNS